MSRQKRIAGAVLPLLLLGACQGRTQAPAEVVPERRSIRDGVYTAAQASRGELSFYGACKRCHGTTEWANESFLRSWSGKSVNDLFTRIYETMPRGQPASLPEEEYADVIAFIFRINNLPVGDRELGTDPAELGTIVIEPATAATDSRDGLGR